MNYINLSFEGETNRSIPDIDGDEAKAEWRFFRKVLFKEYSNISMNKVFCNLLTIDTIRASFPNLITLASLLATIILPVTTVTVERSFSNMKLIKTRLRNRLDEESLNQTMRICIEGPETLNDELKDIVTHWKEQEPRRLIL